MRGRLLGSVLAATLVSLVGAGSASAAPIDVEVRLEGASRTIFDHTIQAEARTVRPPSDSQERVCDGTSGGASVPAPTSVSVLADSVEMIGEDWDGVWNASFETIIVNLIGEDATTGTRFWGVLENDAFTGPPSCSIALDDGDAVLWAYDAFSSRPFLRLSGPSTATTGIPVEFTATTFNPNSGGTDGVYEGAEVDAVDAIGAPIADDAVSGATTGAAGTASVTFAEPGWHRVKARDAGTGDIDEAIASNSVDVCVEAQAGDGCEGDPLSERSLETPVNTADPSITGTPKEGETLSADEGTWEPEPLDYSYAWRRCSAAGDDCSAINGATERDYVATSADVGSTLRVEVTAEGTLDDGSELSDSSAVVVAGQAVPTNTAAPAVRGPAQVGETLVAFEGEWTGDPDDYGYTWQRCDAQGGSCQAVPNVEEDEFLLTPADEGSTIRVVVVASNEAGDSQPATSQASSQVVGAEQPPPELRVGIVSLSRGSGRQVTIRVRSSEPAVLALSSPRLVGSADRAVLRGLNDIRARITGAAAKRLRERGRLPIRVVARTESGMRSARDAAVLYLRR